MTENFNEIWDEAPSLLDYVSQEFEIEINQKIAEFKTRTSLPNPSPNDMAVLTNLLLTAQNIAEDRVAADIRKSAFENLRSDLTSGRLELIALEDDCGDQPPKIIPTTFWLRAQVNSDLSRASTDAVSFSELRVILQEFHTKQQPGLFGANVERFSKDKSGGRPNTHSLVVEEVQRLLREDSYFIGLPNRTAQAREIRALLKGEEFRNADDFPGMKTDTLKRWIGAELKSPSNRSA